MTITAEQFNNLAHPVLDAIEAHASRMSEPAQRYIGEAMSAIVKNAQNNQITPPLLVQLTNLELMTAEYARDGSQSQRQELSITTQTLNDVLDNGYVKTADQIINQFKNNKISKEVAFALVEFIALYQKENTNKSQPPTTPLPPQQSSIDDDTAAYYEGILGLNYRAFQDPENTGEQKPRK